MPGGRRTRMMGARGILVGLLFHLLDSSVPASAMLKLLGGSITWNVSSVFLSGDPKDRLVTFNMRTTWSLGAAKDESILNQYSQIKSVSDCFELALGSQVNCEFDNLGGESTPGSCNEAAGKSKCGVAEKFGVLCVAQLVRDVNGNYRAKYVDDNAQCVHEVNAHHSKMYVEGSYIGETQYKPFIRDSPNGEAIKIGIPNQFQITQIYDKAISADEPPTTVQRKPPPSYVVTGNLSHTVLIGEDVSEVVAWLAPRTGHDNLELKTAMLLPPCSESAKVCTVSGAPCTTACPAGAGDCVQVPCMYNECSLQRIMDTQNEYVGAAFRGQTGSFSQPDAFWANWGVEGGAGGSEVRGCGSGKACLRKASPALETYVPLCSDDSNARRRCSGSSASGVNNYYSPVAGLPDLIEVAITRASAIHKGELSSTEFSDTNPPQWFYRGYNPRSPAAEKYYTAPHQGFRVQSYDYDGHQMTQYSPQLVSEIFSTGQKMGSGDYDIAAGQTTCQSGEVCCSKRSMRVDCVKDDVNPGRSYWPALKEGKTAGSSGAVSGCKFIFDMDRGVSIDPQRKQGNLLKPDFSFNLVAGDDVTGIASRFTQHVVNTIDFPFVDMDNPETVEDHIENTDINWQKGQGIVQNVFSMFGCDAGLQNQPPVFVKGLCGGDALTCSDARDINVETVYECAFWNIPYGCHIDLYARDFTMSEQGVDGRAQNSATDDVVYIQYAYGFDHLDSEALVVANEGKQPSCCKGGAHYQYKFRPEPDTAPDRQMIKDYNFITPQNIGKIFVRCFVAYDAPLPDSGGKSCPSMPLCIKIKITGAKPVFVVPTPLGTSYDDNGIEVPNRHDVPACQGFAMNMQLKVEDSMPAAQKQELERASSVVPGVQSYLDQLKYRIFVEDKDVYFSARTKASYYFLKPGGVGNLDFFEEEAQATTQEVSEKCGSFSGYGGKREGNNALQESPDPLLGEGKEKSVMSSYKTEIQYTPTDALLTVTYEADTQKMNGVNLRTEAVCNNAMYSGFMANCREKLTNMDQVICAVAYDNSRELFGRWVGRTDPNGDDIKHWLRDHSNGDHASDMHCFRIVIAAPPVFVTDPEGIMTPFSDNWSEIIDTTGNKAAYKHISFRVGQERELVFLAQDPNPIDDIEIFILADPGIPQGMVVGLSDCIMRQGENSMCKAVDQITDSVYPNEDWSATFNYTAESLCSRAKRSITWKPEGNVAGQMFKVCAVARDNSNQCADTVPDFATQRGWFGEQQCVIIEVVRLLVRWEGDLHLFGEDEWVAKAYVGCEFKFHVRVQDALIEDGVDGGYGLDLMLQDMGLQRVVAKKGHQSMNVTWVPGRGTEGKSFFMCFAVTDHVNILEEPTDKVCRGGGKALHGCETDDDCEGGKCQKACVKIEVQRCEYCIEGTDTLTWMMRYFGIETNWMRMWALNSFEGPSGLTSQIEGAIFPPEEPLWILSQGESSRAYITDPDGIMADGKVERVYVGAVLQANAGDTLLSVAARFRTTVKTLMAMNPDVEDDEQLATGTQRLCVLPCTTPTM